MATLSARMGNPTEPMTQGLLILLSSIEPNKGSIFGIFLNLFLTIN